jgi:NADPH-dependent 2,4-dienoyl-CoA reductase/sulfur reductase-like enzyme
VREEFDLIVLGAGPAGLSAAIEADNLGLSTLLIDEQREPGGQIYRAVERASPAVSDLLGDDYKEGKELTAMLRRSTAEYIPGATIWEVSPDRWVGYELEGASQFVRGQRIVVATGALERPMPFPGWTIPGVMTAGAAQILLKSEGAIPAGRVVLAGTGPLLYLLTWQLSHAGAQIAAVLDTVNYAAYWRSLPTLGRAISARAELVKGWRWLRGIRRAGIRHITGVTDLAVHGDDRVGEVTYRHARKEWRVTTDLLLLHHGVVPNIQIPRALDCRLIWDPSQLCWRPQVDEWGRTSVSGVYIAGDGAGISGARAAKEGGRIAALSIAFDLGKINSSERDRRAKSARAALRKEARIRPLLEVLYQPRHEFRVPADDQVIVCRCEEVTAGEVRAAVRLGALGPNQAKSFVRCGMGPCQGRFCGLTVCAIIAAERGVSPSEVDYFRLRPPFKPITLGSLAATAAPKVAADADDQTSTSLRSHSSSPRSTIAVGDTSPRSSHQGK